MFQSTSPFLNREILHVYPLFMFSQRYSRLNVNQKYKYSKSPELIRMRKSLAFFQHKRIKSALKPEDFLL